MAPRRPSCRLCPIAVGRASLAPDLERGPPCACASAACSPHPPRHPPRLHLRKPPLPSPFSPSCQPVALAPPAPSCATCCAAPRATGQTRPPPSVVISASPITSLPHARAGSQAPCSHWASARATASPH